VAKKNKKSKANKK